MCTPGTRGRYEESTDSMRPAECLAASSFMLGPGERDPRTTRAVVACWSRAREARLWPRPAGWPTTQRVESRSPAHTTAWTSVAQAERSTRSRRTCRRVDPEPVGSSGEFDKRCTRRDRQGEHRG